MDWLCAALSTSGNLVIPASPICGLQNWDSIPVFVYASIYCTGVHLRTPTVRTHQTCSPFPPHQSVWTVSCSLTPSRRGCVFAGRGKTYFLFSSGLRPVVGARIPVSVSWAAAVPRRSRTGGGRRINRARGRAASYVMVVGGMDRAGKGQQVLVKRDAKEKAWI